MRKRMTIAEIVTFAFGEVLPGREWQVVRSLELHG
jgi:hypothetical protein